MTTRLRKQAERAREKEREKELRMTEIISVSDGEEDFGCPSQWNVEQVFSYINSLPGTAVFLTVVTPGPIGRRQVVNSINYKSLCKV